MKVNKNNVTIIWMVLAIWVVAFLLLATMLPPTPMNLAIGVAMFMVAVLSLFPILSYYRNDPDGKKAVKEAEEWHEKRREEKRLNRSSKWYYYLFHEGKGSNSDDVGFIPMN